MTAIVSILLIGLLAAREILLYWEAAPPGVSRLVSLAIIPLLLLFVTMTVAGIISAL